MKESVVVIVPIFNEAERIEQILGCLEGQDYLGVYEIVFVDNGSTDLQETMVDMIEKKARFLRCPTLRDADAARNFAVQRSSADRFVFTDADCMPEASWLRYLMLAMDDRQDLVAGKIAFTGVETTAQAYDSLVFLNHEKAVKQRGVGFFANLAVHRRVFDKVGEIPVNCASGGDIYFTSLARKSGIQIHYEKQAVVHHPARTGKELVKKCFRIGRSRRSPHQLDLQAKRSHHFRVLSLWLELWHTKHPLGLKLKATVMLPLWVVACIGAAGLGLFSASRGPSQNLS